KRLRRSICRDRTLELSIEIPSPDRLDSPGLRANEKRIGLRPRRVLSSTTNHVGLSRDFCDPTAPLASNAWFGGNMSKSRRQFLAVTPFGVLGAAAAFRSRAQNPGDLPPGAPPAFGTGPVVGPEVSSTTFAE